MVEVVVEVVVVEVVVVEVEVEVKVEVVCTVCEVKTVVSVVVLVEAEVESEVGVSWEDHVEDDPVVEDFSLDTLLCSLEDGEEEQLSQRKNYRAACKTSLPQVALWA